MPFDVFISYSNKDKLTADAACAALESANICCWIAPRDMNFGRSYAESIIDAIERARLFVLIFSNNANASPQINREVEHAASKGLRIISVRIENVAPTGALEYFLSSTHWLDAFSPPQDRSFAKLVGSARALLEADESGTRQTPMAMAAADRAFRSAPTADVTGQPSLVLAQAPQQKPTVFLSFAGEDVEWKRALMQPSWWVGLTKVAAIYDYDDTPTRRGDLQVNMSKLVGESTAFIVLLSKFYIRKEGIIEHEFRTAIDRYQKPEYQNLFCVIIIDAAAKQWWDQRQHSIFVEQPWLQNKVYWDLIENNELADLMGDLKPRYARQVREYAENLAKSIAAGSARPETASAEEERTRLKAEEEAGRSAERHRHAQGVGKVPRGVSEAERANPLPATVEAAQTDMAKTIRSQDAAVEVASDDVDQVPIRPAHEPSNPAYSQSREMPMPRKVFISYRRDDSAGYAGRLNDRLVQEFGDVIFMDVDGIPLGVDFVKRLTEEVASCDVLLAMIGPRWINARDKKKRRRLDNPLDFVRVEISAALQRDIPVIPILLERTEMPGDDLLPAEMKPLAVRNGLTVGHASFHTDLARLIRELKQLIVVDRTTQKPVIQRTSEEQEAVRTILLGCHRRALFTRMHAQLSLEAMFSSIERCLKTIQAQAPRIRSKELSAEVMELLAAVEGIERMKAAPDIDAINRLKVAALHSFRKLAKSTHGSYPLPENGKLGEAVYFTQGDADAPLDIKDLRSQLSINPKTGKANF